MIEPFLYHLDSNVVADLSRGRERKVIEHMKNVHRNQLAVSVVVVGELLVGAEKTGDPRILAEVQTVLFDIWKVPIDEAIALRYAEIRARLESAGQRMSDNDLWVAATALVHNAVLVTADAAFARVPGLQTENWRV